MKDWWYFKLGKSIEKETLMNLSELVGHNLVWLKQEFVEHFNALLHRRSIEEMENDLMKKFKPVTFAEHLEFYYPGIYQDQTESLMTFALGLTLGYPNHSSLEDKWTPDEFQTLLRNWSNLSGPGKKHPKMSLEEYIPLSLQVFSFQPEHLQEDLKQYLK
ncbi:hypothetical protein PtB15_8B622 [Puccinia triticina]|nr:hypothetical protein PtB15_8B622 [Puccinia triticina]